MEKEEIYEGLIKITDYELVGELPDPFLFEDGSRVATAEDWERRRKEIYESAVRLQYGDVPPKPETVRVEPIYTPGFGGVNSFRIIAGTKERQLSFAMQLRLPKRSASGELPPVAVIGDMCFGYMFNKEYLSVFLDNGIALATFNRTELTHDLVDRDINNFKDFPKMQELLRAELEKTASRGRLGPIYDVYPDRDFGSIAAWAWGYSRCVDALEQIGLTDMDCIAFTGHSRGGKTAILAGVLDERAAIVNPNETCAGGCSCYRLNIKAICEDGVERVSERGGRLTSAFPLWMGSELADYAEREAELPFDSHYLKALVAPRVLFVSDAASDIWGNPVGTWQTSEAAKEVYKFLGCEENLLWYFRRGTHYHEIEDVEQLVNIIRHVKYGEPLNDKYFKKPFEDFEPAYTWSTPENK